MLGGRVENNEPGNVTVLQAEMDNLHPFRNAKHCITTTRTMIIFGDCIARRSSPDVENALSCALVIALATLSSKAGTCTAWGVVKVDASIHRNFGGNLPRCSRAAPDYANRRLGLGCIH